MEIKKDCWIFQFINAELTEPTFWARPNEKLYSVSENVQSSASSSLQAFRLNYVPFAQSPATYFENSN